jgi:hypothetical protein
MIKKFCFYCLLVLFFANWTHADTIRCWQVSCRLPHYNEQGQLDSFITMSRRLYVDGQLMMYVYDGNQYYLFHKDSLSGIYWDIGHPDLTKSFRVDSLRQMATPYLTHFGLFKKGFGWLVSTTIDARTGSLKETYCDVNFHKHPNADSCYVTYTDRFNSLPPDMSLSYSLDSLYGKRLCEVRLVMMPAPAQSGSRMVRRAEWSWKLEEIRDFDRSAIQSYFSR